MRLISSQIIHQNHYIHLNWRFGSGENIISWFFRNKANYAVNANGERYRSMITNFLWRKKLILTTIVSNKKGLQMREKFGDSTIGNSRWRLDVAA